MDRTKQWNCGVGLVAALMLAVTTPFVAAQQSEGVWGVPASRAAAAPWLVQWTPADHLPPERPARGAVSSVSVSFDPEVLRSDDNRVFRLRLPPSGQVIELEKERQEQPSSRQLVWSGHVRGMPGSDVVLSLADDVLAGTIRLPSGHVYGIDCGNLPLHWLRELQLEFRIEERIRDVNPALKLPTPKNGCGDPRNEIDVLVVYTAAVLPIYVASGSDADAVMLGKAQQWIAETNDSFVNSLVDAKLRLVHVAQVAFSESGSLDDDVDDASIDDEILCLRELVGADLVVLVVSQSNGYEGVAVAPDPEPTPAHADTAFLTAVVAPWDGSFTFPHEIGHLLGAGHDCDGEGASAASHLDHGFTELTPSDAGTHPWKTIMSTAVELQGGLEQIAYWSNPDVRYPGPSGDLTGATGGACAANNHQIIETFVGIVSEYRCRVDRDDVWMKDLWVDTGDEPDAQTAGLPMWKSPYIWVRRSEDTALEHLHDHQSPASGHQNWIYVKLHNASESEQTGDVEIRVANAATTTEWDVGWTVVDTVHVAHFAPRSCLIVWAPWPIDPNSTGHYCLLARWLSAADPIPASADVENVAVNVRQSNNIVWRNVNVIELASTMQFARARTTLRPVPEQPHGLGDGKPVKVTLTIRPDREFVTPSFIAAGRVRVEFDEALHAAWQAAGSQGQGFTLDGHGFLLDAASGARFEELPLVRGHDSQLTLHFERLASTPAGDYGLDVEQRAADGSGGGLSYVIRCPGDAPGVSAPSEGADPDR